MQNNKKKVAKIVSMMPKYHNFFVAFCLMRDEAIVFYSRVVKRFRDLLGGVQAHNVIVTQFDKGLSSAICDEFLDNFQSPPNICYFNECIEQMFLFYKYKC